MRNHKVKEEFLIKKDTAVSSHLNHTLHSEQLAMKSKANLKKDTACH
jgi:hypothetical protein